jgi:hypothetical protein
MILRPLSQNPSAEKRVEAKPASEVFVQTQQDVGPPCAIIRQADHARLAGNIARALSPDIFGELPPEVLRAIGDHDLGWEESDGSQIDELPEKPPRAFPSLDTAETLSAWRKSVKHGTSLGPLGYVIISRHFALLDASDPSRAEFVASENQRRESVEQTLPYRSEDLDTWTKAIGFADLLSLILCSGSQHAVEFPLAHPASSTASRAQKVTLRWDHDVPGFSPAILNPGSTMSVSSLIYRGTADAPEPVAFSWNFAEG